MEFENATPPTDDQTRLAASARKITLQPISTSVLPEPSDGADFNSRLSETAHTYNPENDREDTSIQRARHSKHTKMSPLTGLQPSKSSLITGITMACGFVAAFLWMTTQ